MLDMYKNINDEAVLSVIDVGRLVGKSSSTASKWCQAGDLKSYKFGGKYVISGADFKDFVKG